MINHRQFFNRLNKVIIIVVTCTGLWFPKYARSQGSVPTRRLNFRNVSSGAPTPPPTPNYGRWKFNSSTGSTAVDSVGSNPGSLFNTPTWVSGGFGNNAIQVSGNQNVVWNPGVGNQTTASFWVNIWVKYTAAGTGFPELVGTASGSGYAAGWFFIVHSDQRLYFDIKDSSSNDANTYSGSLPLLNDGNWHMVTGIVDRTSNTISEYIDGVFKTSASIAAVGSINSTDALAINGIAASPLACTVDDLSIDNSGTIPTAPQIAALFSAGAL